MFPYRTALRIEILPSWLFLNMALAEPGVQFKLCAKARGRAASKKAILSKSEDDRILIPTAVL